MAQALPLQRACAWLLDAAVIGTIMSCPCRAQWLQLAVLEQLPGLPSGQAPTSCIKSLSAMSSDGDCCISPSYASTGAKARRGKKQERALQPNVRSGDMSPFPFVLLTTACSFSDASRCCAPSDEWLRWLATDLALNCACSFTVHKTYKREEQ